MDQIYSINIPTKYENVLVKFTNRNNTHIEGELLEYKSFKCMMSYNDVTKKKKIYSWNKIVPLNKQMVARVDEIFLDSKYVQVSIAYFNKIDNIEDDNMQKYLLKKFNDNKILISILKNIFYTIHIDLNEFWEKIIYPLDNARRTEDINISLLEYFINNKELVINLIKDNNIVNDKLIEDELIKDINKIGETKTQKITSKIGIISVDGITHTNELISKVISEYSNLNLKYEAAPYYILDSNSSNSTHNDHELFINKLKEGVTNKLFIKVDYIAKLE